MHNQLSNVVHLQIHLPGQHMVRFNPNDDVATVLQQASTEKTSLTAFFEANSNLGALGMAAWRLTYQEFVKNATQRPLSDRAPRGLQWRE